MDIYLIRHGECAQRTDEGIAGPPLTQRGREQAEKLAQRFQGISFDAVYCSNMNRSRETARILNDRVKSKLMENSAFREIDMGEILTRSWKDFPEIYTRWQMHEEDIPYPGGENGQMVWERCRKAIDGILEGKPQRIAIITHGGVIRSAVCGLLGLPQQKRFYFGCPPENTSVTIFRQDPNDGRFYLHVFNDISHLA